MRKEEIDIEAGNKGEEDIITQEVTNLYRRFMQKMKLNEETGRPIADYDRVMQAIAYAEREEEKDGESEEEEDIPGEKCSNHASDDREICQLIGWASDDEDEEEYVRRKNTFYDRFYDWERKKMPNQPISNNLD